MAREEEVRRDLRELKEQVEALRETLTRVAEPYSELVAYLGQFQTISRSYFRMLELYQKYGSVSPDLVIPGLKDDISKHIVLALFDRGDRNISQITEAIKAKRGTASRRIVRERLEELEREGVVVSASGSRGRTFRVSEEIVRKWSQVLGLAKYEEQSEREQGPTPQGR